MIMSVFMFFTNRVKWWKGWEEPWIWWPVLAPRSWSPWSTQPRCVLDESKLACVILDQELTVSRATRQAWAESVIFIPSYRRFCFFGNLVSAAAADDNECNDWLWIILLMNCMMPLNPGECHLVLMSCFFSHSQTIFYLIDLKPVYLQGLISQTDAALDMN